jgi:hypothetical protein
VLTAVLLLTGVYPLGRAWLANRGSTLRHALAWAWVAWAAWGAALLTGGVTARYLALCLTGCAGVAVLGARRPGVGAWHFVTLGLLCVLLLPLAEGWGELQLSLPRMIFLAATLAVCFLNYLPTRMAPAALVMAAACGVELWGLASADVPANTLGSARVGVALAPWLALASARGRRDAESEFDRTWLGFRDRFGGLWGQRMREQFNRAAANAGWRARLAWGGLRPAGDPAEGEAVATLRALLKRFEGQ